MSSVTNQTIDNRIDTVIYHRLPGTTVTICQIKMVNGFVVLGESACVNPADFNQEKGESIAHENARKKLWSLEGYLAAERRYQNDCAVFSPGQMIEDFSINEVLDWLVSQPLSRFSFFEAAVIADCWTECNRNIDQAPVLQPGKQRILYDVFRAKHHKRTE